MTLNDIYNQCTTCELCWLCLSCDNSMKKNKTPMQLQLNNMELCPEFSEF